MSNHIHLICRSSGEVSLSSIIRDFKKFTSKEIVAFMSDDKPYDVNIDSTELFADTGNQFGKGKYHKVWDRGYYAIEVSSNKFLDQKIDYIHDNPVKANIVTKPEDYKYSSARNYAGMDGVLEVTVTRGNWITY